MFEPPVFYEWNYFDPFTVFNLDSLCKMFLISNMPFFFQLKDSSSALGVPRVCSHFPLYNFLCNKSLIFIVAIYVLFLSILVNPIVSLLNSPYFFISLLYFNLFLILSVSILSPSLHFLSWISSYIQLYVSWLKSLKFTQI